MSLDRDIALLSRIPLFRALSSEQLRLLAFSGERKQMTAGEILFRAGDPAPSGYVLVAGEVAMLEGEGENEKTKAACEPGSLIGELALFIDGKRPATARTTLDSELLEINRAQFQRMLNEYPHAAVRLRAILADRLTATVGELGGVREALMRLQLPKGRGRRA